MKRLTLAPATTALLMTAAALVLAACNGGGASGPDQPSPTDAPSSTTPFQGSRGPIEVRPESPETAFLTDVRTAEQDGFDRVVFEFEGGSTGYLIEYVEPPIKEDPSDLPIDIAGNAFLRVVFLSGTGVDLMGEEVRITCCSSEFATGLPSLVDLQNAGDFEATMTWVFGLSEEVDFGVSELQDPYRIVIDVAHP